MSRRAMVPGRPVLVCRDFEYLFSGGAGSIFPETEASECALAPNRRRIFDR